MDSDIFYGVEEQKLFRRNLSEMIMESFQTIKKTLI